MRRRSSRRSPTLTERYDRIVITGMLAGVCYLEGMAKHPRVQGIRLFDHPRFAEPLRNEIHENTERLACKQGLEIEFVRSVGAARSVELLDIAYRSSRSHAPERV